MKSSFSSSLLFLLAAAVAVASNSTSTGGWHKWQAKTTAVFGAGGKRDLYFVFRGESTGQLFNFDYWRFNKKVAGKPKS